MSLSLAHNDLRTYTLKVSIQVPTEDVAFVDKEAFKTAFKRNIHLMEEGSEYIFVAHEIFKDKHLYPNAFNKTVVHYAGGFDPGKKFKVPVYARPGTTLTAFYISNENDQRYAAYKLVEPSEDEGVWDAVLD
jgi:hypothetical protein